MTLSHHHLLNQSSATQELPEETQRVIGSYSVCCSLSASWSTYSCIQRFENPRSKDLIFILIGRLKEITLIGDFGCGGEWLSVCVDSWDGLQYSQLPASTVNIWSPTSSRGLLVGYYVLLHSIIKNSSCVALI